MLEEIPGILNICADRELHRPLSRPVMPLPSRGSAFPDSLRSILVTLPGSAVSAAIGFVVQEFLRSRKAASRVDFSYPR